MNDIEIEVKFHLEHAEAVRRRILSLVGKSSDRVFEINYRFDTPQLDLMRRSALLRLRRDTRCTLTYKASLKAADNEFKARRELEVEVGDFDTTRRIIEALGFKRTQIYEKYRQSFMVGNSTLCIDNMPYGDFLEIEGSRADIRQLAQQLKMDWPQRILTNYVAIHNLLRQGEGLDFTDITFDNFRGIVIDWEQYLPRITAG